MYGYGFIVQLYNDNESKGLKGVEYPKGEISFDIDLKLERSEFGSDKLEDITNMCTPILWNYRENKKDVADLSGNIPGRQMYYQGQFNIYDTGLPLGIIDSNRDTSVYDSGNISM